MKRLLRFKGLAFVLGLFGLNALFWFTATPSFEQPLESVIGQWQGANILLGFTIVFFLSTKNRVVVFMFDGLEKSYKYHRVLAMLSLLMVFAHAQFSYLIWQGFIANLPLDGRAMGALARNLFVGLIVIALLAKYMKYEHWRLIHRLMVIPYLAASYHAFVLSSYPLLSVTPLGLWMMSMVLVGTASSLYMIVLYRHVGFPFKGAIVSVTHINDAVTEIEVELEETYDFQTGQFTFIKIKDKPFNNVPHPFSLSGKKDGRVLFTIKAIGDYTQDLFDYVQVGQTIAIGNPLGHMTFDTHKNTQVWLAGGIGVTPFLSHLRAQKEITQTIRLYYAVNDMREAVHVDLLASLAKQYANFSYRIVEAKTDGYITLDKLNFEGDPDILMCGPRPMALTLAKALQKEVPHLRLTYEAFSFTGTLVEDLIRTQKNLRRKFKRSA